MSYTVQCKQDKIVTKTKLYFCNLKVFTKLFFTVTYFDLKIWYTKNWRSFFFWNLQNSFFYITESFFKTVLIRSPRQSIITFWNSCMGSWSFAKTTSQMSGRVFDSCPSLPWGALSFDSVVIVVKTESWRWSSERD